MKMEQIECSETSAYKIQTPGNHPEENIQRTEHGENLKSNMFIGVRIIKEMPGSVGSGTPPCIAGATKCTVPVAIATGYWIFFRSALITFWNEKTIILETFSDVCFRFCTELYCHRVSCFKDNTY
jgi:hypothetical protein